MPEHWTWQDELPNQFRGRLSDTALQAYNDAETIPAKAAMRAMIAHSDNNAVTLLTTHWPANESSGFQQFLAITALPMPQPAALPRKPALSVWLPLASLPTLCPRCMIIWIQAAPPQPT